MNNYSHVGFGNIAVKKRIQEAFAQKKMPHALLLTGPKNTGKYDFLYNLSKEILHKKNPISPFLVVIDELYKEGVNTLEEISKKNNASFNQFERKKSKKKSDTIGVEDIEEATKHLYETIDGNVKIVIIRDIERMTIASSNKFLKLLEEPPQKTFFFLTTSAPLKILSTITSRCRFENFSLLSKKEIVEVFENQTQFYSENEKKIISLLSSGKSKLLEKMLLDEDFLQKKKEEYNEVKKIFTMTPLEKMQKAEDFSKENISVISEFLELLLVIKREEIKTSDSKKTVEVLEKIDESITFLQQNGNKRLVLESLFLGL